WVILEVQAGQQGHVQDALPANSAAKGYLDWPRPPSLRALMLGKMSRMILPKLAALRERYWRLSQYLLGGGKRRTKHAYKCFSSKRRRNLGTLYTDVKKKYSPKGVNVFQKFDDDPLGLHDGPQCRSP
ncbi:hypothetical protein ANANG_G00180790, partial [Anguilla anguilla]